MSGRFFYSSELGAVIVVVVAVVDKAVVARELFDPAVRRGEEQHNEHNEDPCIAVVLIRCDEIVRAVQQHRHEHGKAAAAAEALALDDCGAVLDEAYRAAQEALAETPELLPVLKEAGVVDAGGQGFLYILDGIRGYMNEGKFIESNDDASPAKSNAEESKSVVAAASGDIKYGYCSEFLITKSKTPESTPLKLKAYLESIGDCVVVVDDDDIVKVHVHSNEPGNVIQAALKIGQLINIK